MKGVSIKSHTHLDSTHDSRKDKTCRLFRGKKIKNLGALGKGGSDKQGREERVLGQCHCLVTRQQGPFIPHCLSTQYKSSLTVNYGLRDRNLSWFRSEMEFYTAWKN